MPLDDLVSVIETLQQRIRDHGATLRENETRTRMSLIDPLLRALGWDVSDPSAVTPEYSVGNGRADYALMNTHGRPMLLIEAKHLSEPLERPNHQEQVFTYALVQQVRYASLTDGDRWILDDVSVFSGERRILDISLSGMPAFEVALKMLLLWRPNLSSGQPVDASVPLIHLGQTPQTGEMDEVGSPARREVSHTDSPIMTPQHSEWTSLSEFNPPGRSGPPPAIRFPDGFEQEIKHWNDVLVAVATWLNSSGRLTAGNVPVQSSSKTYIVHSRPTHPTGNEFYLHREIANAALVVNTHGSATQMRKNARTLLEHCGVNPDEVWLQVGQ